MAAATRARIVDAATELFLDAGYARTTTAAIARAARTSEASVFAVFGTKVELLLAVIRDHVRRDGDFPLAEQPIWRDLAAREDKAPAIETAVGIVRRAHERSWRLLAVAAAAAQDDPVVARAQARGAQSRHDDAAWFVRDVMGVDAREVAQRADEVWTLISVDNYRHLVVERGWTPEQYEAWLSAMLAETLRPGRRSNDGA
jgi:AcrR family transcriptional regulator